MYFSGIIDYTDIWPAKSLCNGGVVGSQIVYSQLKQDTPINWVG